MEWRQRAAYLTYRAGAGALELLPQAAASVVASTAGLFMSQVWRGKRPLLRRTFARVLGPGAAPETLERCVRGAFRSYAHYWVDAARLGVLSRERLHAGWEMDGQQHLDAALATGKGVVLALPHLGSWEYAGRVFADRGYRLAAVAEVLEPPELFQWFVEQRERLGITIVPLQAGSTSTLVTMLRQPTVLCLLSDRDLGGNGVPVEFFGEETTLPAGPATLALRSGAALMTCAVYYYPPNRHYAVMNPPIDCTRRGTLREDIARLTRELAAEMEVHVRRAPEQWHMFQPNWPSDRERAT